MNIRSSLTFSKTEVGRNEALSTFQFSSNFMDSKDGMTPMMKEDFTDQAWTSELFLNHHFQF
jgi:hypothetical protein